MHFQVTSLNGSDSNPEVGQLESSVLTGLSAVMEMFYICVSHMGASSHPWLSAT